MMQHNSTSYSATNEKPDVVQYNHYEPASALADTAFGYDFVRCVKDKPFWVMETQVGWNGSEYAEGGFRPAGESAVFGAVKKSRRKIWNRSSTAGFACRS